MTDELLMIPGPTNVPGPVLEALSRPSTFHRGDEFARCLQACTEGLKEVFQTRNDVLILTASGTGGVEAAIVNCLSPGDSVVAIHSGKFGERMEEIATRFGAEVLSLDLGPGQAAHPDAAREALQKAQARALLFVQNETSTGVCQNVEGLAAAAHECGALSIVDAVSGMGGIPVRTDEWRLDVVVAGSQKAFMLPPGLAFVSVSNAAWQATETAAMPRYYFDLVAARKSLHKGQTPYTPNVNMFVALEAALGLMLDEGMEAVYARHASLGRACRAAMTALGLELLADPQCASDVVTAVKSPPGLDSTQLVSAVRTRHNILISGGQGDLKGRIFRIGHLGSCQLDELLETIQAVAQELAELGHACSAEEAVAAAQAAT